ncbi:MAG: UMP kinase [Candidatus Nealsonbacteria bacterium]
MKPIYQRIVLKLGGEALAGPKGFGIDPEKAKELAVRIKAVNSIGVQVAIIMGAGNIWRGIKGLAHGMDRATTDEMGMLATVMNCLALSDALTRLGTTVRLHTSIEMKSIAEPYVRLRAIYQLEKGYTVIIGAGTGNPYFTTDTAAALRAMEINANVLIKATKVDGIYTDDPKLNSKAQRLEQLTYMEAINRKIKVLDNTAITLCMNNNLPIFIIGLSEPDGLKKVVRGEKIGSLITSLPAYKKR